ncbi:hypothetical protein PS2_034666 [Malus domestica]
MATFKSFQGTLPTSSLFLPSLLELGSPFCPMCSLTGGKIGLIVGRGGGNRLSSPATMAAAHPMASASAFFEAATLRTSSRDLVLMIGLTRCLRASL